jgi:hypothetical protein
MTIEIVRDNVEAVCKVGLENVWSLGNKLALDLNSSLDRFEGIFSMSNIG